MNPRPGRETSDLLACSRLPARAFAEKINQPLPGVALAKQPLAVLQAKGRGKAGTHALIDVIRGLTPES